MRDYLRAARVDARRATCQPAKERGPVAGMVQTRVPRVAEAGATNPERKACRFNPLMDCIARATHTRVPSGVTLTGPLLNHAPAPRPIVAVSACPDKRKHPLSSADNGCLGVGATGLEPVTPSVSSWCSSQLS